MASALRPMAETCGTPPFQPFSHPKQGVQQDAFSTGVGSLSAMSVDSEVYIVYAVEVVCSPDYA